MPVMPVWIARADSACFTREHKHRVSSPLVRYDVINTWPLPSPRHVRNHMMY